MRKLSFAVLAGILIILAILFKLSNLKALLSQDTPKELEGDVLGVESTYEIKVASSIASLNKDENNNFEIQYLYKVTNNSNYTVRALTSENNLNSTFKSHKFEIVSLKSDTFKLNSGYNGKNNTSILAGTDTLAPSQGGTITLTLKVYPENDPGPFKNSIEVWGLVDGPIAEDKSKSKDSNKDKKQEEKKSEQKDEKKKDERKKDEKKDENKDTAKDKPKDKKQEDKPKEDKNKDKGVGEGKDKDKKPDTDKKPDQGKTPPKNDNNQQDKSQDKTPTTGENKDNTDSGTQAPGQGEAPVEDNNRVMTDGSVYGIASTSFLLDLSVTAGAPGLTPTKLPETGAGEELARTGLSIRSASLIGFSLIFSTIELYALNVQKRFLYNFIKTIK